MEPDTVLAELLVADGTVPDLVGSQRRGACAHRPAVGGGAVP
jgi:hypothetical protein